MKTLHLNLIALLCLFSSNISAQRVCGSADHYQDMLQSDLSFKQNRQEIEAFTDYYTNHPDKKTRAIKTIPVVVHVVYNTAVQNISDAQILSQIDVLNKDFRRLNSDWTGTPSVFQPLVADCEIEFCLAKQDPAGNLSTGIVRKSTTVNAFGTNDAVKKSIQGGDDAWDASKYLNIWVCNLSGAVLGYAQFPGGPAATDGVVITYTGFGTIGTASFPFNLGRTATHEVGHWLNLFHIWGDDAGSCNGSDQVNDTPNQGAEHYGCPTFPQLSCSNGPDGDLYMNYMDYTDDACMFMFTAGQKARIDALFANGGARASILNSSGCVVGSTVACGTPATLSAGSITPGGATINWAAVAGSTYYNVQYKTSASSVWTTIVSTSNQLILSGLSAGTSYNVKVQAICNSGNGNFSAAITFNTMSLSTCSNSYEPNNSMSTSVLIGSNTSINSMLINSGDNDYYRIVTTNTSPKLKVLLSNLPADFDLRLYNAAGQLLRTSALHGSNTETVTYNNATVGATYYAYVSGYAGAYSPNLCYTLSTQSSASNLKEEEVMDEETKPEIMLFPNPAQDKTGVEFYANNNETVMLNIYSAIGQRIKSQSIITTEGLNQVSLNVSEYSNGIYILEMIQGENRKVQRFMIQH